MLAIEKVEMRAFVLKAWQKIGVTFDPHQLAN